MRRSSRCTRPLSSRLMSLRAFITRPLQIATLLLAGCATASAAQYKPETPDAAPNLGLLRSDAAGGLAAGHVYAVATHPHGGVIVGGEFLRTADGAVRTHLLRLRADGTLDPDFDVSITSQARATVNAIATDATGIYIGGNWQKVDNITRPSLAKLTFDGELIQSWHPAGDNTLHDYDDINAIATGGGAVYVGGDIETLRLMGMAKLDAATGTIDTDWRAPTQRFDYSGEPDMGYRSTVHTIVHTGTDLIVGGAFGQIARVGRQSVARLSLTAPVVVGAYSVPSIGGAGTVTSLALDTANQRIYVGGRFFAQSGQYDNLIRTNAQTGVIDANWTPDPSNEVSAIALAGNDVYYGGRFTDTTGPYLVRTRASGNGVTDSQWLPLPDKAVRALVWQAGAARLWVGGEFVSMGAHTRNGLARFSFAGKDLMFRDGLED